MSYFEYNDVYAGYSKEMNVLQGILFKKQLVGLHSLIQNELHHS